MKIRRQSSLILAAAAALLLAGGASVCAGAADVKFDQGADASKILGEAREKASRMPAGEAEDYKAAFSRWEEDCVNFSFAKEDAPLSERVYLESRMYEDVCYDIPERGRNCHEEWTHTERRAVRLRISGRGRVLPWERDIFRVCLDGQWLSARVVDASHEYTLQTPGGWDGGTIEARAGRKIRSLPDPVGIIGESFRYDGGSGHFLMTLKDRWAEHYGGEQTVLEIKLRRHHKNWFDSTVWTKEISVPAAEAYTVRFADYADEIKKLQPGKRYYVKWRFKRVGDVSKDKWQGAWTTDKAIFGKASAAMISASALWSGPTARKINVCWFQTIEKDQCVYKCRDGKVFRQPVQEPDPYDPDSGTIPCPQLVIPF